MDKDQGKILGFTKEEAEILIMSIQVMKPNTCSTNGVTAPPPDLVRIGAYETKEMARTDWAKLRARVMALPSLPKRSRGQPGSGHKIPKANEAKEDNNEEEGHNPFLPTEEEPNPFLLTEEEKRQAALRAGLRSD